MRKIISSGVALAAAMVILTATTAYALQQTNGSGLSHNGASVGFNAKANLKGNFTYTTHDGTGFQVKCRDGYTRYQNQAPTSQGDLRTHVTATCKDKEGTTIYMEVYFIDRGEPGVRDVERIFFTYDAAFALDANGDPAVWLTECNTGANAPCNDVGIIHKGNVQIH